MLLCYLISRCYDKYAASIRAAAQTVLHCLQQGRRMSQLRKPINSRGGDFLLVRLTDQSSAASAAAACHCHELT